MATNSSPFIVNIVDLQNVAIDIRGGKDDLVADVANLKTMVNPDTQTIYTNNLSNLTPGSFINVEANLNLDEGVSLYSNTTLMTLGGGSGDGSGIKGATGDTGPGGGPKGDRGPAGPAGPAGAKGDRGLPGPVGARGPAGVNGTNGIDGINGIDGADGTNGIDGATGAIGQTGATGISGTNISSGAGLADVTGRIGDYFINTLNGQLYQFQQIPLSKLPSSISGLQNWYDASDPLNTGTTPAPNTIITTWYDKSGNGKNTLSSGGNPIKQDTDGLSFLKFESSYFNTPTMSWMSNNPYTLFLVETPTVTTAVSFIGTYAIPSTQSLNFYYPGRDGNTFNVHWSVGASEGIYDPGGPVIGRTRMWVLIYTPRVSQFVPPKFSIYLNGSYLSKVDVNSPQVTYFINRIGYGTNATSYSGKMREIIVYQGTTATANRQLIEGYLAWKWGIRSYLPQNHPYNLNNPTAPVAPGNLSLIHI